jgi:hypothetical protein
VILFISIFLWAHKHKGTTQSSILGRLQQRVLRLAEKAFGTIFPGINFHAHTTLKQQMSKKENIFAKFP